MPFEEVERGQMIERLFPQFLDEEVHDKRTQPIPHQKVFAVVKDLCAALGVRDISKDI